MMSKSTDVLWQELAVSRADRERMNQHKSAILWFTGLSGAGKSTLARAVEERLHKTIGARTYVLDGDNMRHGLCGDLGFTAADRSENIRRVGEVAKLFVDAGVLVLTAFISPFRDDRDKVRALASGDFIEVYCQCSLAACEARDVKGLYKKARAGGVQNFTGISSPYEEPVSPELVIDTENTDLEQCVDKVLQLLRDRGIVIGK